MPTCISEAPNEGSQYASLARGLTLVRGLILEMHTGRRRPRPCPEVLQRDRKVRLSKATGSKPTSTSANAGKAASVKRSSRANW